MSSSTVSNPEDLSITRFLDSCCFCGLHFAKMCPAIVIMNPKFLLVGNSGRESFFARKLAEDSTVYAVMQHENPTIVEFAHKTDGGYIIGDTNDGDFITDYAVQQAIDYAFVNSDEPLAKGVVDALLAADIKAIGPTRAGARIEWDKVYAMQMMDKLYPEFTPFHKIVSSPEQLHAAITSFKDRKLDLVVKPQGLTAGKGVKVMGEHLENYQDAADYATQLLSNNNDTEVLLVEKLEGIEFTIMGLTDGEHTVFAPATYDYPYRFENDQGPGTGGMGCFADKTKYLPFMSAVHFDECSKIMRAVIQSIKEQGAHFNGILNGGFFLTGHGIKFMEFNARFGDPECINILSVLKSPFSSLLKAIEGKTLNAEKVVFADEASVVKYLVTPSYPQPGALMTLNFPVKALEQYGLTVSFSSVVATGNHNEYKTVSASRIVALSCTAKTIVTAAEKINLGIDKYVDAPLEYRHDIAMQEELKKLNDRALLPTDEILKKWRAYIKHNLIPLADSPLEGNFYSEHQNADESHLLIPKQRNLVAAIAKLQPKKILEIGFNGGFSALLMKMTKPDIKLTCVDINEHPYVIPCYNRISKDYENIELITQNSSLALPKLIQENKRYDAIHIDGDHSYQGAKTDLDLCLQLSNKGTVIIFDDTQMKHLDDLCDLYVRNNLVKEYNFNKATVSPRHHKPTSYNRYGLTARYIYNSLARRYYKYYYKSKWIRIPLALLAYCLRCFIGKPPSYDHRFLEVL